MPDVMMITPTAYMRIKQLCEQNNIKNAQLRVYILGGGCSGFQYGFRFDDSQNETDIVVKANDISVLVDAISLQYLHGAVIDFQQDLMGSRFVVNNPNAKTTCGCGSSFAI